MEIQELQPDLERIYGVIVDRRDHPPQDKPSSTVRLLNTGWMSTAHQTINPEADPENRLVKLEGIGDKLIEEAVEIVQSEEGGPDKIIAESAQAIYYIMVGIVYKRISLESLFRSIDQVSQEQKSVFLAPHKLAEYAADAVARVALAGVSRDSKLVQRRSAEALIGLNRFWESHGIFPTEVGHEI